MDLGQTDICKTGVNTDMTADSSGRKQSQSPPVTDIQCAGLHIHRNAVRIRRHLGVVTKINFMFQSIRSKSLRRYVTIKYLVVSCSCFHALSIT